MIVVSDTSALCYLLLIDQIELLPQLYGVINVPQAVAQELSAKEAPSIVQNWIRQPPGWLNIEEVNVAPDVELEKLDLGEREAIALAEKLKADLIVLDDKAARQIAAERGLTIIGLLGILKDASSIGLIDLPKSFEELREVGFWVAPSLLEKLLNSSIQDIS